jgi:hypothetical protein
MGRINIGAMKRSEALFAILGLNTGDWITFPRTFSLTSSIIPIVGTVVPIMLHICGVFVADLGTKNGVALIATAYILYFTFYALNALSISTQGGRYLMAWKSMSEDNHMAGIYTIGDNPPVRLVSSFPAFLKGFIFIFLFFFDEQPYLFLTDGGHLDNLGLIELFKRRCKLMVAFDAGYDPQVFFLFFSLCGPWHLTRDLSVGSIHSRTCGMCSTCLSQSASFMQRKWRMGTWCLPHSMKSFSE